MNVLRTIVLLATLGLSASVFAEQNREPWIVTKWKITTRDLGVLSVKVNAASIFCDPFEGFGESVLGFSGSLPSGTTDLVQSNFSLKLGLGIVHGGEREACEQGLPEFSAQASSGTLTMLVSAKTYFTVSWNNLNQTCSIVVREFAELEHKSFGRFGSDADSPTIYLTAETCKRAFSDLPFEQVIYPNN